MKIKELIEFLSTYPEDSEVCISVDPEINQVRSIESISIHEVRNESTAKNREVVLIIPTDTLYEEAFEDEDVE
jgi:hypothetical protein